MGEGGAEQDMDSNLCLLGHSPVHEEAAFFPDINDEVVSVAWNKGQRDDKGDISEMGAGRG